MKRRALIAAGAGSAIAAATWPLPALAAGYPDKPIRLVVPFGAGGVADLTARAVGQALAPKLGQSIVVDNRPGAGGVVAGDLVAKAAPDGYTLLLMSNGTAVSEGLFKKLPFDARKDFAPISLLGEFDLALVVPQNSRFRTVQELLAEAKAKPGTLNIGSINVGSTQHLSAELIRMATKADFQVVPFNGSPAVLTALRGGQIDASVEILAPLLPQIRAGAVRALAVLGKQRSPFLPQVPTLAESAGVADFNVASWNALAAPAGTPSEIIERLAREARAVLASDELRKQLAELSVQARSSTPAELAQLLDSEIKRWSDVIARAGIAKQ
ncbi:tripartite tricarboxylate transporter substrate binding protein [Variovorax dokdonensis]|uniref:Tripartite tricarboxylate transporter substrate binding protein n=1 Tax=Variovorax dokdonensis TaxID=344883 RepID=A0ABT7N5C7_9BURK|nr:tripartite tricarboxylate transporter substrate binding protein [Variovorax dokdonensis]MDM0043141.1 tripartite tricarboxylate transporter substrate binding protein [Variovorax dokdonensis]